MNSRTPQSFLLLFVDLVLVNISFFIVLFFKQGTFISSPTYLKLLLLINSMTLAAAFLARKTRINCYQDYRVGLWIQAKWIVYSIYLVALTVVLNGLTTFSRLQILGTFIVLSLLATISFSIYHWFMARDHTDAKPEIKKATGTISISIVWLTNEFVLITVSFFLLNYYKRGTVALSAEYEQLLLVLYGVWLATSFFTRKFEFQNTRNFFYFVTPYLKSFFLMVAIMAVVVFFFRLFNYSRLQIFGTFVLLLFFETVYNLLYFLDIKNKSSNGAGANGGRLKNLIGKLSQNGQILLTYKLQGKNGRSLAQRFKNSSRLTEFVSASLDMSDYEDLQIGWDNTCDPGQVNGRMSGKKVWVNEYLVNDIRRINRYFLQVHRKLKKDSYFAGRFETVEGYKRRFFNKYSSKVLAQPFYLMDILLHRIIPKLPLFNRIYFFLTEGENRVMSTAEVLGRLCYCGFQVLATKDVAGEVYFLARKASRPKTDKPPNCGLIITLERVGLDGDIIAVKKLRTMSAYSEFLQQYLYEHQGSQNGDKIENDFRVRWWGRVLRKLWIDEIPMLYNLLRGDIKLVGVRPLSLQKLSLYKKTLREKRMKNKPGLIPPFYADMPESFEELMESEEKYLESHARHPVRTDIKYASKAIYNILIRNARSQ